MSLIPLGILAASGAAGFTYEQIATTVMSGSTSTVTFSSIPSGYKHLQIRYMVKQGNNSTNYQLTWRFNSDSANNYSLHRLYIPANGSVTVFGSGTQSGVNIGQVPGWANNMWNMGIIDIYDYASTSKTKTVRALNGSPSGGGQVEIASSMWNSTAAISSITASFGLNFQSGTRFSLYGIRG